MSDVLLKIIPTDPQFIPNKQHQKDAERLLVELFKENESIEIIQTEDVQFIDQGTNLIDIHCPKCESTIDISWWQEKMNNSYNNKFSDLYVKTHCCNETISLNDLSYNFPAGFSRFVIVIHNPNLLSVPAKNLSILENMLKCKLRVVISHV